MKTLIVVPARMASSRLPGKIAKDIGGYSSLEHVVRRARSQGYTTVVAGAREGAADTQEWTEDVLAPWTQWRRGLPDKRGRSGFVPIYYAETHENDVLGRISATVSWAIDMDRFTGGEGYGCIVRLTPDCPFVPISAIDAVAEAVTSRGNDYCETRSDPSNRPNGIDAQAFTTELLFAAEVLCNDPEESEHVTPALKAISENPGRISQLEGIRLDDLDPFRITLDTAEDLMRLRAIASELTIDPTAGRPTLSEIVALYRERPELFVLEKEVAHK